MLNYSQTIVSPLSISRAVLARADGGHADVRPGVRRFLGSKHVPRCYSIQEGPVFIETQVRGKALKYVFPWNRTCFCFVLCCCRIAIRRDAAIQKEIAKEMSNKSNKNEKDQMSVVGS